MHHVGVWLVFFLLSPKRQCRLCRNLVTFRLSTSNRDLRFNHQNQIKFCRQGILPTDAYKTKGIKQIKLSKLTLVRFRGCMGLVYIDYIYRESLYARLSRTTRERERECVAGAGVSSFIP